jgi:predicted transcriptional regulator
MISLSTESQGNTPRTVGLAELVIPSAYFGMKTAISLPDALYLEADGVAARLGVSRSHLYATALEEYLAKFRSAHVTAQFDAVYADAEAPDPALMSAARKTLRQAKWP